MCDYIIIYLTFHELGSVFSVFFFSTLMSCFNEVCLYVQTLSSARNKDRHTSNKLKSTEMTSE